MATRFIEPNRVYVAALVLLAILWLLFPHSADYPEREALSRVAPHHAP